MRNKLDCFALQYYDSHFKLMTLPKEILPHINLPCSYVWRSIGTHIWFEFGIPKIIALSSGRRSIEGEMTLHISSYNWRLMINRQRAIDSDTVNDENFASVGKKWIVGNPVFIKETETNTLELVFSTKAILEVFPTDKEEDEAEVSFKLPCGQWWQFNFGLGWHQSPSS